MELDHALVDLARRRGVEIRERSGVTRLHEDDAHEEGAGVTATLADGTTVRARWVVAADGHYSPVRRLLRGAGATGTDLGTWHAFRQYFTGVDDRRLWVLFEEDFLPG